MNTVDFPPISDDVIENCVIVHILCIIACTSLTIIISLFVVFSYAYKCVLWNTEI